MSRPATRTVCCRGAPAHCRQWYRELARLIASTSPPAAALFESASDHELVRVTVRPAQIVELLGRSLAGAGLHVDTCPGAAPASPSDGNGDRIGYVLPSGNAWASSPIEPSVPVDRVGIAPGLLPGDWLGLQTFWVPASRGRLWLMRRFRWKAGSEIADVDRGGADFLHCGHPPTKSSGAPM